MPEGEIYRQALLKNRMSASASLFIDDRAENVQAAKEIGLTGHLFESTQLLRNELDRLGLIRHRSGF